MCVCYSCLGRLLLPEVQYNHRLNDIPDSLLPAAVSQERGDRTFSSAKDYCEVVTE